MGFKFLKELLNPELKCKRLGCKKVKQRFYNGYEKPKQSTWHVVDKVKGYISFCPRCGDEKERTVTKRKGFSSWSCPSHMSDAVDEKGFYELR